MIPSWLQDLFAHLVLAVAAVSAFRLIVLAAGRRQRSAAARNIALLLIAVAVAAMLTPALTVFPDGVWKAVFAVLTAWFAYQVVQDARSAAARGLIGGNSVRYLAYSAAALYMSSALAPTAQSLNPGMTMSGMGGTAALPGSAPQVLHYSTLALAFALILVAYGTRDLDQLPLNRDGWTGRDLSTQHVPPGAPAAGQTAASEPVPAVTASALPRTILMSPGMTVACQIVLGITLVFALITLV